MIDEFDDVKKWYDGYYVLNGNITIYNPLSVVKYLECKKCGNYWVQSGSIKHLQKIFLNENIGSIIEELLQDKSISILAVD